MTERLNARIDAELARKVLHLRDVTGKSTTEVIKASIEAYYARVAGGHRAACSECATRAPRTRARMA